MSLKIELEKIKKQFLESAPQDIVDVFGKFAEKLAQQGIEEKALKVGDKMPSFVLKNAVGERISSDDLLAEGPLVINFYRGGW